MRLSKRSESYLRMLLDAIHRKTVNERISINELCICDALAHYQAENECMKPIDKAKEFNASLKSYETF